MHRLLALVTALFLATPLWAHDFVVGDLQILHPHIPQPAKSARTAGGYLAIVNGGDQPDRLIGVESEIAEKITLHESKVDATGMATMAHVAAIEVPAGATVSLERGGLHIMFMGLTAPLTEGQLVKATLILERAGRVEVEFSIDPLTGGGHDHMAHDGH